MAFGNDVAVVDRQHDYSGLADEGQQEAFSEVVNRLPNLTLDRRPILTLLSDGF